MVCIGWGLVFRLLITAVEFTNKRGLYCSVAGNVRLPKHIPKLRYS
jgi:hypothetical protein